MCASTDSCTDETQTKEAVVESNLLKDVTVESTDEQPIIVDIGGDSSATNVVLSAVLVLIVALVDSM